MTPHYKAKMITDAIGCVILYTATLLMVLIYQLFRLGHPAFYPDVCIALGVGAFIVWLLLAHYRWQQDSEDQEARRELRVKVASLCQGDDLPPEAAIKFEITEFVDLNGYDHELDTLEEDDLWMC